MDGLSGLFPLQDGQTLDADQDQKVTHALELQIEQTVLATIKEIEYHDHGRKARRVALFVDGLDLYLATTGHSLQAVRGMLGKWREVSVKPLCLRHFGQPQCQMCSFLISN